MDGVLDIVDVRHDAPRHRGEAVAEQIHHGRQRVVDALGSAQVLYAARQTLADPEPPVDLGQQQHRRRT